MLIGFDFPQAISSEGEGPFSPAENAKKARA
jgi:hypothetical protein